MALNLDQIRSAAQRVAASHGLDVVDVEYQGGAKHRQLRIFIEKNAEQRAKLAERLQAAEASDEVSEDLPSGDINPAHLAGITHDDCQLFSTDFGTLLDVEELIHGGEYTLEVSSPGLDRRLYQPADYERFLGSLVKLSTFEPVAGNRHWQGRLKALESGRIQLDLTAMKQKSKGKAKKPSEEAIEIELANVEKANLIPEI
jgi:ribosome maturation factor RimP